MKTKAIVTGAVVLVVLLFLAILLAVSRKPPQDITVRHIKSVQSARITTMTFEIKNHTANTYSIFPHQVQVRNGNAWTNSEDGDYSEIGMYASVGPTGLVYRTVHVRNLPAESIVRLSMYAEKELSGLHGLYRRAKLKLKYPSLISLNPYDRKIVPVYADPIEVTSDEFVEP